MVRFIVTLGLSFLSVPALIDYVKAILTAMTGNPYFPSPPVGLSAVGGAVNQLETAWQASQETTGGPDETALVKTRRFTVVTLVKFLAAYVEYIANTNYELAASIIFSANMGVKAGRINTGRVFEARNTAIEGQVLLFTRSAGNASYEWQYTLTPNDPGSWVAVPSTSVANTMINGLTPGSRVYFRVRANRATPGPWQGPVNLIVT